MITHERLSMKISKNGWLYPGPGIQRRPSPNFNKRPDPSDITLLVIHNISLPPGEFGTPYVRDLFLNQIQLDAHPWFENLAGLKVSAHFLITRKGRITQFVSCNDRAWHAGVSLFNGREQCNDFSIGIELEGTDDRPYTKRQYDVLATLTANLRTRYPLDAVRGHCHIAPDRKTDPGSSFDWNRYANQANWDRQALPPDCLSA